MNKIWQITLKDIKQILRDPAALLYSLLLPFLLTLGMGLISGAFNTGGDSGGWDIGVRIVNQDDGALGQQLVSVFQSDQIADLVDPLVLDDFTQAKAQVDAKEAAAAFLIPAGFSASIYQPADASAAPPQIQFYIDDTDSFGPTVVRTVLDQFLTTMENARVTGMVSVEQLLRSARIAPAQAAAFGEEAGRMLVQAEDPITVNDVIGQGAERNDNLLSLMAPGMALMFLMYTATNGGRTLLAERRAGTLQRILVSPTATGQVLAGKITSTFIIGLLQVLILILATSLLFKLPWGDPLGVLGLSVAAVFAACGWGLLVSAISRTATQVANLGSAMMLIFSILGGSFLPISGLPAWLQTLAHITPNAWGMDGFSTLAREGDLARVLPEITALLLMGLILFAVALYIFRRRGLREG